MHHGLELSAALLICTSLAVGAASVIELAAGQAAALGIGVADRLELRSV